MSGVYSTESATGGRAAPQQAFAIKRVQVVATDSPHTDRWVLLTTARIRTRTGLSLTYRVGVVDGFGRYVETATDYPTLRRARNAANRQLNEWSDR